MKLRDYKSSLEDKQNIEIIKVDNVLHAANFYMAAFGFEHKNKIHLNCNKNKSYGLPIILGNILVILSKTVSPNPLFIRSTIYQKKLSYNKKIIVQIDDKNIHQLYLKGIANSAISIQEPTINKEGLSYCILQDFHGCRWVFIQKEE